MSWEWMDKAEAVPNAIVLLPTKIWVILKGQILEVDSILGMTQALESSN